MESNDSWIESTLNWLFAPSQESFPSKLGDALGDSTARELSELIELLVEFLEPRELTKSPFGPRFRVLLQMVAARSLRLRLEATADQSHLPIDAETVKLLVEMLGNLPDAERQPVVAHCLQILTAQADAQSLAMFSQLLSGELLTEDRSIAVALSPLFQWPPSNLEVVFDSLGDDIWKANLLGPMLDLSAHCLRKKKLHLHPLAAHATRLGDLLGATVQKLSLLEENPKQFGSDAATIAHVLSNAVALTVSLCDTVSLIGHAGAADPLKKALELSHRRVQTEAAGALTRFGDATGQQRLLELTSDPLTRLRAVAYADELGLEDRVPFEMREPIATAEAEAVTWLADNARFGVPPAQLDLVDERTQFWPSYDNPQSCFLWRFNYLFPQGELSNLIISGPLVHAFQADLKNLEIDDVYGLFAGWHAEHDEIYEIPSSQCNSAQRAECDRLVKRIIDRNGPIEEHRALGLAFFFGERSVLAVGLRNGQSVCFVADDLESVEFPINTRPTSLTPDLVLALFRGRKLLRTFN